MILYMALQGETLILISGKLPTAAKVLEYTIIVSRIERNQINQCAACRKPLNVCVNAPPRSLYYWNIPRSIRTRIHDVYL